MGNKIHEVCHRCQTSLRGPLRKEKNFSGHHVTVWYCPECDLEIQRG